MIKKTIILTFILFLLSNVSASCNSTQVNINSAPLEELDKIVNIGPARAGQIISLRPFESVDDLIRVVGIGNATLQEIKQQGLACVNENIVEKQDSEPELQDADEEKEILLIETPISEKATFSEIKPLEKIILSPLNPQTIKSQNDGENKSNYAVYGLIAFCFLLAALFTIKKLRKNKNEFRQNRTGNSSKSDI